MPWQLHLVAYEHGTFSNCPELDLEFIESFQRILQFYSPYPTHYETFQQRDTSITNFENIGIYKSVFCDEHKTIYKIGASNHSPLSSKCVPVHSVSQLSD